MNTDAHEEKWLHGDLVYRIIGCALEVLNSLGHGLDEKPYENGLLVEFQLQRIAVNAQKRFEIVYKHVVVGEFVPDLIVGESVVVDTKVVDRITDHERGQMLNYLRITKLRVGLIINFKKPKLEWERVIL